MHTIPARVTRIDTHSKDICTIHFTVQGSDYAYKAGQYITVYFDSSSSPQGKAYSLSSAPSDTYMSITVKRIGEFSRLLHQLRKGDTFQISEPYGHFYVPDEKHIVALAAGVGIAPIWSIIKHHAPLGRSIDLHYSNTAEDAIVFRRELASIPPGAQVSVKHYITRGATTHTARRIRVASDIDTTRDARYYICGSQDFVTNMWRQLRACGVDTRRISTETFFESSSW